MTIAKLEMISEIKRILGDWGSTSTGELQLESSPILHSFGHNQCHLIESFYVHNVTVVIYVHEMETDEYDVNYEDLNEDIISEIYYIMEQYDIEMNKTMENIRDENF